MKTARTLHLLACATLVAATGLHHNLKAAEPAAVAPVADTQPYQVPQPEGAYQAVDLTVATGIPVTSHKSTARAANQSVRLAFRGETLVNWWFIPVGARFVSPRGCAAA